MINPRNAITPTDPTSTLLAYSLFTQPDPLQVNGAGILTLVVSKSPQAHETITCTEIKVTLLAGKIAELTPDASTIDTQVPSQSWHSHNEGGVITLTPTGDAGKFGPKGISFVFSGFTVNGEPGTTMVKIDETASSDSQSPATRTTQFLVPKFPTQFYLSDLTLSDTTPEPIPYDGSATLMWISRGDQVTYSLEYLRDDDGPPVTLPSIGSTGPYTATSLTRTGSVAFNLTAKLPVPGQDQPLLVTRQLIVQIETLSLKVEVAPPAVGVNGLMRLTWHAPNADHCTLEDGTVLAPSGTCYFVLKERREFTITAYGERDQTDQRQETVEVLTSIAPTEAGPVVLGAPGTPGRPGANRWVEELTFGGDSIRGLPPPPDALPAPTTGEPGKDGESATFSGVMPPLDITNKPSRVISISLTGGKGGTGGMGGTDVFHPDNRGERIPIGEVPAGNAQRSGRGGRGGDAILDMTLDSSAGACAQYVISLEPGLGGDGGPGAPGPMDPLRENPGPPGPPGDPGVISISIRE